MATTSDMVAAIDAFVSAQKRIHGSDVGYSWGPGHNQYEVRIFFPLEIEGELPQAARLEVIGFPRSEQMQFRLSLCYNAAICRLDYTDETHPNTMRLDTDGMPSYVEGPHYHSWPLNRRFFKGASTAPQLHNAAPFNMRTSFDSILRWFCAEMNIEQLDGGHLIQLPPRDTFL